MGQEQAMTRWARRVRTGLGRLVMVAVIAVAACRAQPTKTPGTLAGARQEAARLEAHLRRHPDDGEAWRDLALIQWAYLGQPQAARKTLDRLSGQGDIYGAGAALVMAWARDDAARTWIHAERILEAVSAHPRPDPSLIALGDLAVRRLGEVRGERAGDDERLAALYERLATDRMPYRVRQPLLSLRAALARRQEAPYRQYFAAQGCVQVWDVGPVEGTVGALDLRAVEGRAFQVDADAALARLACVVRVWNPTVRAGVRRLRTAVAVAGDMLRLELAAETQARVYVDGTLVHRTDRTDRWTAKYTTLEIPVRPGRHQIRVAVAVPEERAWILVRATEANGDPVRVLADGGGTGTGLAGQPTIVGVPWASAPEPLEGPYHRPFALALALEDALEADDPDRAESLGAQLRRTETFPEGMWLVAKMERADPSRGRTASATREQRALHRALELDPTLDAARRRALAIQRGRGEDAEVREALEDLEDQHLDSVAGHLFRWRVYRALGNELQARAALDRAATEHPEHCDVLMAQRTEAVARDATPAEDLLVNKLARCPGSIKLRARLSETRGRWEAAERLWRRSLERIPDDMGVMERLAGVAVATGRPQAALQWHQAILDLNPFRVGSQVAVADLLLEMGQTDQALDRMRGALARIPHSSQLRRTGETMGLTDDLLGWREDGRKVWLEYQKSQPDDTGVSEALVLDRTVARVYPNRGIRMIIHLVVHLASKEALDSYGEIAVPEGATLLTLRSLKPDGTILEPESIPGKDGLSLRDLEIGDAVDYEYIIDRGPPGLLPGYVDVTTFRFQSPEIPYHRSELLVVHPQDLALREDRRNNPPTATVTTQNGLTVRHWLARNMPRLGVEPNSRAMLDELPNVRVFTTLNIEAWLRTVALQIRHGQRANPELRRRVRRLTRGKKAPRERLLALWRWVTKHVEDTGDLSSGATATLAARRGNRMMLLLAMLREADVEAELWLAANRFGPAPLAGGHPMVEMYDTPVLAVHLDGHHQPRMVLTSSRVLPIGYLAPAYAGAPAVRVPMKESDGPAGPVRLPAGPATLADRRTYHLTFELNPQGNGTATGSLELQGMEAVAWRQALEQIDRDRIEEAFQQAELTRLGRGLTLEALEIRNERDLHSPLVLEFRARADGAGIRQGGELAILAGLVPLNGALPYTGLPRRKTGLVVNYGPLQEATVEFRFSGGRLARVPDPVSIRTARGMFERTVEGAAGDHGLTLRLRSQLRPGVVEPSGYEELTRLAQAVEAAERAVISVRPDAAGS